MLQFQLLNRLRHSGYAIVLFDQNTRLAVSSDQFVSIFSYPALDKIEKLNIRHVSDMVWMKEENTLLIVTALREVFVWNHSGMKRLGQWPEELWAEEKLVYCGESTVATTYASGICLLNARTMQFQNIYSCHEERPMIAGFRDGLLYGILVSRKRGTQNLTRFTLNPADGGMHCMATDRKFRQCWPSEATLLQDCRIVFCVEAPPHRFLRNNSMLPYTVNEIGHVENGEHAPAEYLGSGMITVASSEKYIASICSLRPGVIFYRQKDLSFLGLIPEVELQREFELNPPAAIVFPSETECMIGTWNAIYFYRIMDGQKFD